MDWDHEDSVPAALARIGEAVRARIVELRHVIADPGAVDALCALEEGPLAVCEANPADLGAARALLQRLEDAALDALGELRRRVLAIDLNIALVAAEHFAGQFAPGPGQESAAAA